MSDDDQTKDDLNDTLRKQGSDAVRARLDSAKVVSIGDAKVKQHKPAQKFQLTPFADIRLDLKRRKYLVKGLLASTALALIWGPPKSGKSFWSFDLALHIALGRTYRGRRVQQAVVVYIALEGVAGFDGRIEAFRRANNVDDAPFYLMAARLDLIADHVALVKAIKAQLGDVKPGAVFIDTLNRSLIGSESKDEDMAHYIAAAEFVAGELSCAVIIVHHCGIDATRPRGHTSLTAAVESQIAVTRDELTGIVRARVEYAKDFAEGAEIFSLLERVVLGKDLDGDEVTSLVVVPADRPRGEAPKPPPQNVVLAMLVKAIAEAGEKTDDSKHIPKGARTVTVDLWRRYAYQASISGSDNTDTKLKAFNRAAEALQKAGKVGVWGGRAWVISP